VRAGRDLALAVLAATFFGTTILFSRTVARDGVPPSVALGIRFACAGALLALALFALRRPLLPPPGERAWAFALGFLFYGVEATFFYMALERGTAAAVALIFYAYPAVVAVVETLLGTIRLSLRTLCALVLAISGSAIVAIGGGEVVITPAGIACVCGSIAVFTCYAVLSSRVLPETDSLTAAMWTAVGAASSVLLAGTIRGELEAPSASALAAILANGATTAIAFTLWFIVIDRLGATRTAICMALEAVVGVVLAAVFLDESVRAIVALGGAGILLGAVLAAVASPARVEATETGTPP
jgi:drug/metabolite transporter (DMT)-like permease